jgi:hypothetical protein
MRIRAGCFAFAVLVSLCTPSSSRAGQVQTLPSQQVPQSTPTPRPFIRQPGENQRLPVFPGPQGNTREIPLPQVFRGCWSGSVPDVDSFRPLRPDAVNLIWLTKTYTLCYKQAGYSSKWQLTFAESKVANPREATDQRQSIKVKAVNGPNRAELVGYLHFRTHAFVNFWGAAKADTLDELTHLHCDVIPEQEMMAVKAVVFVERNGQPDVSLTWHANFFRDMGGPVTGGTQRGTLGSAPAIAGSNRRTAVAFALGESIVLQFLAG